MKNIIPVLGLCMVLCGCGEDAPPTKSNSYTPPVFKKNEPAVAAPVQAATPQAASTSAKPAAQPATQPAAAQPATAQPAASNTSQSAAVSNTSGQPASMGIIGGTAAVVDYATGATPLTAKKKMTDKIQSIQNQQNQNQQRVLNEK